jgi:hypothetical protein
MTIVGAPGRGALRVTFYSANLPMADPVGRFALGTRIHFESLNFICVQEGLGLEMLPASPLPNLIGGEEGLHAPTSDDFTDTMSNLDKVTETLAGLHLPDQDASEPAEG